MKEQQNPWIFCFQFIRKSHMMVTARYSSFTRVSFYSFLWQHNFFDSSVTFLPVLADMLFFKMLLLFLLSSPPFCANITFGHFCHCFSSRPFPLEYFKLNFHCSDLDSIKNVQHKRQREKSVVKIAYFSCRGPGFSSQWKTLGGSQGPVTPVPGDLLALVHTLCS